MTLAAKAGELLLRAVEGERAKKPVAAETIMTDYAVIAARKHLRDPLQNLLDNPDLLGNVIDNISNEDVPC